MKTCSKCGDTKDLTEFTRSKKSVGYNQRNDSYHAYCKVCNAELARIRRKNGGVQNKGRINNIPKEDRPLMSAIRYKFNLAKSRIKKKDLVPTDLTEEYLFQLMKDQKECCIYTGLSFILQTGHPRSPSLDQIEPSKGYIQGNVQWVSWAINRAKGDLSEHDFLTMCKRVTETKKPQS